MLKERNIVVAIILSLVTCGIYGIYWFVVMTNDVAENSTEYKTSGVTAFVLTLVTCGIYGFYWYYKMGKAIAEMGETRGIAVSDNSVIYIILALLGLGIVNYVLMQSDLNKMAN